MILRPLSESEISSEEVYYFILNKKYHITLIVYIFFYIIQLVSSGVLDDWIDLSIKAGEEVYMLTPDVRLSALGLTN